MSDFMRYVLLIIFVLVVIAIIWVLRDGFTLRNGGGFSGSVHAPSPVRLGSYDP